MEMYIEFKEKQDDLMLVTVFYGMGLCHRCGYVGVPKGHKLYGADYVDDKLDGICVHGGLTYSSSRKNKDFETEDYWYFGFDCAHCQDSQDIESAKEYGFRIPPFEIPPFEGSEIRTKEYVVEETKNLAKQIREIIINEEKENKE